MTIPISVVIPVRNEEANLPLCLSRLVRFSEVVVVDSSSTDRTPEIARDFGARYVNFTWNGKFPKKRNWLLLNHKLANDWVLFLDADEIVDDAFCTAAKHAVTEGRYVGFWLNYANHFLGRPLRYGVAQRKLAMFRVRAGLYEQINEDGWSSLDMEIHEHPILKGLVGEITARIEHNDDHGIVRFIDRHRDYALWEARRYADIQEDRSAWVHFTRRQRFKYYALAKWWYPWFYFAFSYFAKLGLLDGGPGFHYAVYKALYFQTIRLMIKERK